MTSIVNPKVRLAFDALDSHGCEPKPDGSGFRSKCPSCRSNDARKLSLTAGDDGRALLHCHGGGCEYGDIVHAIGLSESDLMPDDGRNRHRRNRPRTPKTPSRPGDGAKSATTKTATDWTKEAKRARDSLTDERLQALTESTGIPATAWDTLDIGWVDSSDLRRWKASGANWCDDYPDGSIVIPERDGAGRIVGLALRTLDGRKGAPTGGKRGLTIPMNRPTGGPCLVVEGASDVAAGVAAGLDTIGRPSATSGAEHLAEYLADSDDVLIVGENDAKPDGKWPGRDGAIGIAQKLANTWGRAVTWTMPPDNVKDLRQALENMDAESLLAELQARASCVEPDKGANEAIAEDEKPQRESVSTQLINLIRDDIRFELFHEASGGDDARAFISITDENGGQRTVSLKSKAFRTIIGRAFYKATGRGAPKIATDDALGTLQGMAQFDGPAIPVGLRLAEHDGIIYYDLGDESWRVVRIECDGWEIIDAVQCPIRFYRRRGMLPVPEPTRGGSVDDLRPLLNLPDTDAWMLAVGWLVAALNPSCGYPILVVNGEQGSAKSVGCKMLRLMIDPNKAPLRKFPKCEDDLAIAGSNSRILAFDNLSGISAERADLICSVATGVGFGKRELWTDDGETIINIRRPVMLNGIDELATRGDLASRAYSLRLEPISNKNRRTEAALWEAFECIRAGVMGALFDAVACAMRCKNHTQIEELSRMADAGAWIEAGAEVLGWRRGEFLAALKRNQAGMNAAAVELNPIGRAVEQFIDARGGSWEGSAGAWFDELNSLGNLRPIGWPQGPKGMGNALRRIAPNLRGLGWTVNIHDAKNHHERTMFKIIKSASNVPDIPDIPDLPEDSADCHSEIPIGVHGVDGVHGSPTSNTGEPDYSNSKPDDWGVCE